MTDHETYLIRATMVPQPDSTTLLRMVSILHSRGAQVHELNFDIGDPAEGATLTARVTSGNAGCTTLRESLLHVLDVIEVSAMRDRSLDLFSMRR